MARLIVDIGTGEALTFELGEGTQLVGRAPDNAVSIPHRGLSRRHASLELSDGALRVCDLGSKNGVTVDGARVADALVQSGQTFYCGDLPCVFVAEGALMPPAKVLEVDTTRARVDLEKLLDEAGLGPSAKRRTEPSHEQTRERLRVLLRVGELLSSPSPLGAVLDQVLDLAFQILPIDHAAVLLREEPSAPLVVRAARSRKGPVAGHVHSRAIVDDVMSKGATALFSDLRVDSRLAGSISIASQSICASMCATLRPRDELIGVLYVDNRSGAEVFSGADLEFLEAFASLAALSIDNARLCARLEREAVVRAQLLRFFPPSTAARVLASGTAALPTVETEVTALFCDICGFTALSSELPPRQIVALLNAYFETVSEIVFEHEGTLEKYIGDALLAVWGAPFARADDADRAVHAAVEVQSALAALNTAARREGRPAIALHIGLNTGLVAAGNVGSERYLQYATVGDSTNVASRICAAAGEGEVLIADSTRVRLTPGQFTLEPRGEVVLRGKPQPVRLFRVTGMGTG